MNRLGIMSDLHIDLNAITEDERFLLARFLRSQDLTHLHLAGDISNDAKRIGLPFIHELQRLTKLPVTFNWGNHDYLRLTEKERIAFPDPGFLNLRPYSLSAQTALLAFNGWYDYSFAPDQTVDFATMKRVYWFDGRYQRPETDPLITDMILQKLTTQLEQTDKQVILALHFVPHHAFVNYSRAYNGRWDLLTAYLGSQRFAELFQQYQDRIQAVVFGHSHLRYGYQEVAGINYASHPFGYIKEWRLTNDFAELKGLNDWNDPLNIPHRFQRMRHLTDFTAFRREHMLQEFQQALTIIPYH